MGGVRRRIRREGGHDGLVSPSFEDDADVRNLVEAVLSQAGFDVHGAATGREGSRRYLDQKASVVTLDMGLRILTALKSCAGSGSSAMPMWSC